MRILVFGGRKFNDTNAMMKAFNEFYNTIGPITAIIQGEATGADRMARNFAINFLNVPNLAFPANWKNLDVPGAIIKQNKFGSYNAIAGHQRNEQMILEGRPDWGMGFPGGTGTADMSRRLKNHGIPIFNAGYKNE